MICCCACHAPGLKVGDTVDGFCGGEFGRDGYDRRIVEVIGPDWVVLRREDGGPTFYSGKPDDLLEYANQPRDEYAY